MKVNPRSRPATQADVERARREGQGYKDAEYDRRRRNACCVVCGCTDERTRSGGALCARCLTARRQQKDDKQIKLF